MKNIRWMLHGLIAVMLLCRAGAALAEVVVLPVDDSAGLPVNEAYYQDATHYQDPSIQVSIETYPWEQTVCYVARITIANPTQLRTASAYGFNRKQVASVQDMANRMNAVLAINGDYSYYQLSTVGCYLLRQGQSYCQRWPPAAICWSLMKTAILPFCNPALRKRWLAIPPALWSIPLTLAPVWW